MGVALLPSFPSELVVATGCVVHRRWGGEPLLCPVKLAAEEKRVGIQSTPVEFCEMSRKPEEIAKVHVPVPYQESEWHITRQESQSGSFGGSPPLVLGSPCRKGAK
nr:hypothetical protein Iba_chr03bCG6280 [Ipomoea batatas]